MSDTTNFAVPEFEVPDFEASQTVEDIPAETSVWEDEETTDQPEEIEEIEESIAPVSEKKKHISNPNSVHVEISAKNLPVVLLFGPRNGGKTMVLVRLTRFLKNRGYTVEPISDFRPSDSEEYKEVCENFRRNINSQTAAASTHNMDFLLVRVSKDGRSICQFLEAPGEHYFDEKAPTQPFPAYIHSLLNLSMPRTWVFFLEKDWKDLGVKRTYADKITSMLNLLTKKDRVILLHPKADQHADLYERGVPQTRLFLNNIREDYAPIFSKLGKPSILDLFRSSSKKDYYFVPFSSGVFSKGEEGVLTFTESNDMYPAKLWDTILKSLRN